MTRFAPKPRWPGGVHCAVAITVDFDGPSNEAGKKLLNLGAHSHGRYSAKRGVPRYIELFKRQGIHSTFFVPGYDAECHPDSVLALDKAGHEVAAHGYLHEAHDLGAEEPFYLEKSHKILTDILGKAPVGWRNPGGGKSNLTLRTLHDLGYIYDSSEKDADLPFFPVVDGREMSDFINIPDNTSSLDDAPFYRVSFTPPSEVLAHWKQEFTTLYREGSLYDLIVHPRAGFGSGTPARARIVDELITWIKGFPSVGFFRLDELARWCIANPDPWRDGASSLGAAIGPERRV